MFRATLNRFDRLPKHPSPLSKPTLKPKLQLHRSIMTGGKSDAHDLSKGDKVSWSWGSQHPSGTVKDVKDDGAEVKTKKGSTISKDGSKEDPAVVIETANGNNAVKKVSLQKNPCPPHSFQLEITMLIILPLMLCSLSTGE